MLMFSDLNLNQFEDSVKMALKRTIVQHELIFKDQVHELHRLYWTQKNLMRELYHKELEAKVLSQSLMVGLAKDGIVGSLEQMKGKFTDLTDNRHRGFVRNCAKISIIDWMIRPEYSGAKVAVDEKGGGMVDKGENFYHYEAIDLEGLGDNGFKIPRSNCSAMGSLGSDNVSDMASSSRIQNETGFVLDLNIMHTDCSERWREHKADDLSGTDFDGKQYCKVEGSESEGLTECFRKTVEGLPNIVAVNNDNIEDKLANDVASEEDGPDENFLMERKCYGLFRSTACTSSEKIMEENSETTQLDSYSLVEVEACMHDEEDHAVIDAADILASISLTHPSSQLWQLFNNKNDQPEYSSDSFETMILELPEVRSHEQHLIMPTRQTGRDTEEETASSRANNKVRTSCGRAVCYFQQDVLPGMVSLSRREICVDMHSIRFEHRKNGSRRGNCFVPVKSGQSRRYPIRQRH